MMRGVWTGFILGVVFAAGPYAVAAQSSADAYFHQAAQEYVAGNTPAARRAVKQGLAVAPSDPRLQALLQKLRQSGRSPGRQDSSSANNSNRSQQNENASADESSESNENASESEQSDAQQPGPRSDAQSGAGQSQSSAQNPSDGQRGADAQPRSGEGRPVDTLSRAQAERLLRALEGQERQLLRRIQVRSATPRRVEKDW
jgi:hypothetical protein